MKALFKDLYRQYLEKGVSPTDFGQFKEELNHIPDEELWNVMIDMEKDATTEIGMPPMMKKQIRKEMHQIIWRRRWIQITKYAAVIALLVTSSLGVYSLLNTPETQQMITANVKSGSKSEIILPDGTKVQLNGATTITYDVNSSKQRLVQLSGEAFFDVAKNPEKPFVVSAKGYRIRVLGTKFNISAYKNSKEFETDLVEGCVHIYDPADIRNEVFLQPKEKAVLWGDRLMKRESDFDNEEYLKNGVVSFLSEPFGRVLNSVALWNDVNIKIERSVNATQRISGKFRQSDSLESILKALQGAMPFKYKIVSEEEIIIY